MQLRAKSLLLVNLLVRPSPLTAPSSAHVAPREPRSGASESQEPKELTSRSSRESSVDETRSERCRNLLQERVQLPYSHDHCLNRQIEARPKPRILTVPDGTRLRGCAAQLVCRKPLKIKEPVPREAFFNMGRYSTQRLPKVLHRAPGFLLVPLGHRRPSQAPNRSFWYCGSSAGHGWGGSAKDIFFPTMRPSCSALVRGSYAIISRASRPAHR